MLFDIVKNGRTIPALAQSGKLGFMFILDRTTGTPIYDVVERPVAKGDVPGEWYSPTQPIPVKPPPVARVSLSKEDLVRPTDTSPEHAAACAKLWDDTKFFNSGPYTPWQLRDGHEPAKPHHSRTHRRSELGWFRIRSSQRIRLHQFERHSGNGLHGQEQPLQRSRNPRASFRTHASAEVSALSAPMVGADRDRTSTFPASDRHGQH